MREQRFVLRLQGQHQRTEVTLRQRLLVSYLLRDQAAFEVNGLRRALGSSELERIAPHITVLPPQNLAHEDLSAAWNEVTRVATHTAPMDLELGGPSSFPPDHHVLYLQIREGIGDLVDFRDRCNVGALATAERRPFVPHVTIRSHLDNERVRQATELFAGFVLPLSLDRLTLLRMDEQSSVRHWIPIDEVVLGSAVTVGRGGEEVQITRATMVSTDDELLLNDVVVLPLEQYHRADFVLRATVGDALVGLCIGRRQGGHLELSQLVVAESHRRRGIARQLLAYLERMATEIGVSEIFIDLTVGETEFFERHGFVLSMLWSHHREIVRATRVLSRKR